jgi:lactate dehydrogenase-like 2-hydroxyacid dehydrogenase
MICSLSSGYEGLPLELCKERGIIVCNSAGSNADDVADIAVTHVLAQQSSILPLHTAILAGRWEGNLRKIRRSLMETRIGIVGLGAIGLATAKRLAPHGCDIAWWGPRDKPGAEFRYEPSLKALADWCHILVIAGRADHTNRHMIDKEIIDAVGKDGIIVNVTRGLVIDEDALIDALKSGRLGGAGLDVFETEPTPAARWKDVPNVTLTPHAGGGGTYSVQRYRQIAIENFDCFFAGKPIARRVG